MNSKNKQRRYLGKKVVPIICVIALLLSIAVIMGVMMQKQSKQTTSYPSNTTASSVDTIQPNTPAGGSPLLGKKLYTDSASQPAKLVMQYKASGDINKAELLDKIASQPVAIWLVGPSESDMQASRDINLVTRTSTEAAAEGSLPLYQLYALPIRDACETYSNGGFANSADYLAWLDRILAAVKSQAIFSVEADAIGHTLRTDCLTPKQKTERYQLLNDVMTKLAASPKVAGAYLDAGHSEWFPDPKVLVDPLVKSGVTKGSGIAVNVSNFVDTAAITKWSKSLVDLLGSDMGVIIDTSRNGKGTPDAKVTGDRRWCNPVGRGLGNSPSLSTGVEHVDAYVWIKIPGESDGNCGGYPSAGQFVEQIALDLASNAL